ncbi:hypothetical protein JCM8097_006042 [Rhodosporidiobolus ruineniae]
MVQLSTGAVAAMYEGTEDPVAVEPILQVLSVKKVNATGQGQDRYRLILSDGERFVQAMLTTTLNDLVLGDNPEVTKFTVVKLPTYAVNNVQNRRIVIILSVESLEQSPEKIGNPQSVEAAPPAAAAASTSAAPATDVQMQDVKPNIAQAAPQQQPVGRGGSNASKTAAARRPQGGAKQANLKEAHVYPIESLSPYQNKWTIKARVTSKSDVRHWQNQKGEGKLFSVNFLDDSGEIRATGFNKQVDDFYEMLVEGQVYMISRARVNIAKKQFSNLNNEYEIMFGNDTEIQLVEDAQDVPTVKFEFTQLADLNNVEKDATCDVLGVVVDNGQVSEITTKATQKQIKKRELVLADRSQYQVRVTLWGRQAESWQEVDSGIVAIKGVKVGDFGGRSLSVSGGSMLMHDPDIPEAHELRGWYDTQGSTQSFQSFSNNGQGGAVSAGALGKSDAFKTLQQVVDENLGMSDKPDYFSCRATVSYIKSENLSYPACPTDRCNKKMNLEGEGSWRCEKCELSYEAPQYRYILSMTISDYTGQIWVSGFNEVGQALFGKSADELQALKEDDEAAFGAAVSAAFGRMLTLNIKARADTYGDQTRVRYQINRFADMDWGKAALELAEQIEKW